MMAYKTNELQQKRQAKEVEFTKTMIMIVINYIVCWTPVTVHTLIFLITKNHHIFSEHDHLFQTCAILIAHFNSALDPSIYAYRMREVRKDLKNLFQGQLQRESVGSPDECVN